MGLLPTLCTAFSADPYVAVLPGIKYFVPFHLQVWIQLLLPVLRLPRLLRLHGATPMVSPTAAHADRGPAAAPARERNIKTSDEAISDLLLPEMPLFCCRGCETATSRKKST